MDPLTLLLLAGGAFLVFRRKSKAIATVAGGEVTPALADTPAPEIVSSARLTPTEIAALSRPGSTDAPQPIARMSSGVVHATAPAPPVSIGRTNIDDSPGASASQRTAV